jgi:hypothetical protein
MSFVPSYRGDRIRQPAIGQDEADRWSVRRALAVMLGLSLAGWAAIVCLTALVAG